MPQKMPGDGRSEEPSSEHQSHHISSIAHLFFAEDESAAAEAPALEAHKFVVTCFNESRISAFACAGLATGTRTLVAEGAPWSVQLQESSDVPWSAHPFLPADTHRNRVDHGRAMGDGLLGIWQRPGAAGASGRWVQWSHQNADGVGLEAGNIGQETAPTLVVCLLVRELGQWEMAFNLGRLLGAIQPQRLEVLVFPDTWAQDLKPDWGLRFWHDRVGAQDRDLLAQCHNLTRAIGGVCPVTITALPKGESEDGDRNCGAILQKIALRLTSDFSPPSFG